MFVVSERKMIAAGVLVALLLLVVVTYYRGQIAAMHANDLAVQALAVQLEHQKAIDARAVDMKADEAKTKAAEVALTPAQAQKVITRIVTVPGAPVDAPVVTVAKEQLTAADDVKLPDSASYTLLTQEQSLQVARNQMECDLTGRKLDACTKDVSDYKAMVAAANARGDAYAKALKGGTWLQRTERVAVPVGCAAAGAFAGAKLKDAQSAAIGAAVAGLICAVAR